MKRMTPVPVKSSAPSPMASYTEAYKVGHLVFAAGQLASDFKTGIPPEATVDRNFPFYGSEIKLQTRSILENLTKTFEAADSSLENVVKAQVFMRDMRDFSGFDEVWKDFFGDSLPARTTVGTTELLGSGPAQLVEIDLIGHTNNVEHEVILSDAPRPLANYTEAIRVGNLVFAAGQVANDYVDGIPPEARVDPNFPYYGSDIKLQTRYILENFKKTFAAANSSLGHVVKAQVFLRNLHDFNGFDEVWKEYFANQPPARTTVGTTELLGSGPAQLVEIDLIAQTNDTEARPITSSNPQPLAAYTEAWVVEDLVFAAGQLASDFRTGVPLEARANPAFPFYGSNIKSQTRYILENLTRTFEAAGSSLSEAFKAQVFMADLRDFNAFDEVWKEYFTDRPPARTTVGTTGLLVKDTLVEVDLIGAVK